MRFLMWLFNEFDYESAHAAEAPVPEPFPIPDRMDRQNDNTSAVMINREAEVESSAFR